MQEDPADKAILVSGSAALAAFTVFCQSIIDSMDDITKLIVGIPFAFNVAILVLAVQTQGRLKPGQAGAFTLSATITVSAIVLQALDLLP